MLNIAILVLALQIPDWRPLLEAGQKSYTARDFADAAAKFEAAAEAAGSDPAVYQALRYLSAVHRETGDLASAEVALQRAVDICGKVSPNTAVQAGLLEDLSQVQRSEGKTPLALVNMERAIAVRRADEGSPRTMLARDMTTAASMYLAVGQADAALQGFQLAIKEWDAASPGDYQALPALDTLAGLYRDMMKYEEAELLLERTLRIRESVSGPESSDVITSVDSLGFIEFGLRKMPETERLYKRLLALWIKNAGPDHPMVALTYDKIAEMYSFLQRYPEAEEASRQALALRTRVHVASLNQTGRILLMEAKFDEAADLYKRALEIGELSKAPDEALDPVLRTYALVLRRLKRDAEADALQKRIDKNAEKIPLRPAPANAVPIKPGSVRP